MLETVLLIGLGILALVVLRPLRPDVEMDARLQQILEPRPSSRDTPADASTRVYHLRDRGEAARRQEVAEQRTRQVA